MALQPETLHSKIAASLQEQPTKEEGEDISMLLPCTEKLTTSAAHSTSTFRKVASIPAAPSTSLPRREVLPTSAARATPSAPAASISQKFDLEANHAQVMKELAQKEYAAQLLRQQVQQKLSEQLVSATSSAWHEGAQASSRIWGRILAHFEVSLMRPLVMRAAFATWQTAVQTERCEHFKDTLISELTRMRMRHCVASSALVAAKETCHGTLAAVLCFSAWARLCKKDQHRSQPTNKSAVSLMPSPEPSNPELQTLLAGQHRMEEWLVGLSAKQHMLQQWLTSGGAVDMSVETGSPRNCTEYCALAIGASIPTLGTEKSHAAQDSCGDTSTIKCLQRNSKYFCDMRYALPANADEPQATIQVQQLDVADSRPSGNNLRSAAAAPPDVAALLPGPVEEERPSSEHDGLAEFGVPVSPPSSPSKSLRCSGSSDSLASTVSNSYGFLDKTDKIWAMSWHKMMGQQLVEGAQKEHQITNCLLVNADIKEELEKGPPNNAMVRFVHSPAFNAVMGFLILANTVTIGIEADATMRYALKSPQEEVPNVFSFLGAAFSAIFALELVVKVLSLRWWFFLGDECGWNVFDFFLVLSSLFQMIASGLNMNFFRVLRVFRMVRALRILRVMRMFRELRRMTLAIMSCVASLSWAFLLLLLITYVFAILFMQAAAGYVKDAEDGDDNIQAVADVYGSMFLTMYSLVQAISGGNDWANIAGPLEGISTIHTLTFVFYVFFVTYGVLNVLTGVFLESAAEIMDRDLITQAEISRKKAFASDFQQLFKELDLNKDGKLDWDEFRTALSNEAVQAFFTSQQLEVVDAHLFFRLIAGKAEEVTEHEFIFGCTRLRGEAKSMHINHLHQVQQKLAHELHKSLEVLTNGVSDVQRSVSQIQAAGCFMGTPPSQHGTLPDISRFDSRSTSVPDSKSIPMTETGSESEHFETKFERQQTQWWGEVSSQLAAYKKTESLEMAGGWCGMSSHRQAPQTRAAKIAMGSMMNCIMGLLICMNTVIMGFETDASIQAALANSDEGIQGFFGVVNVIFIALFTLECLFKIYALRLWFFLGDDAGWNIFDAMLVCSSLAQLFLEGLNVSFLRVLRVFRMIRALRILRVLRMFCELRRMSLAIVNCLVSLAWAFLLLLLITYVFAILFVQAASAHVADSNTPDVEVALVKEIYGSLPMAMYSLIQAISGGNDWAAIAEPLEYISVAYTLLFLLYELFVTFGVLNVLTGVFLEGASEIMDRDLVTQGEVSRRKIFVRDMQAIFKEIDTNGSGRLSWKEFEGALKDPSVSAFFTSQELDTLEAHVLFNLIAGNSEEVSIEEFILGCTRLRGSARSMHVQNLHTETLRFYSSANKSLQAVKDDVGAVRRGLAHLRRLPIADADVECGVPRHLGNVHRAKDQMTFGA